MTNQLVMTFDQFKDLPFIDSLYDSEARYIRQQGWDALTLSLGLGPKNGTHACGRFAGHRRLPVNLDTLRGDVHWECKLKMFFLEETALHTANPPQRTPKSSRRLFIHNLYRRILYEIWFPQVLITLQRRFKAWTYSPGNPGYERRRRHFAEMARLNDTAPRSPKTTTRASLCCGARRRSQQSHSDHEWSD